MDKRLVIFLAVMLVALGCAAPVQQQQVTPAGPVSSQALVFDPIGPSALPEVQDLPVSVTFNKAKTSRRYIGIIKNTTGYDLAVPSKNSSAALPLPAKGFIEYTAWQQKFDLTVYRDGKPFYCLKIEAHPKGYPYMCSNYDFFAEVVAAEPVKKHKPVRKKRHKKKKPVDEGVKGFG
jgi:hypothetical protein